MVSLRYAAYENETEVVVERTFVAARPDKTPRWVLHGTLTGKLTSVIH